MKKLKNCFAGTIILLASVCLIPSSVSACRIICFNNGNGCYEFEGNCPASCDCTCTAASIALNPKTDYILVEELGPIYIVQGETKTKIATDNMVEFMKKMVVKYQKKNKEDLKIKKEMEAEWASFLKKPDNSRVSASRLKVFEKETGLKVVRKGSISNKESALVTFPLVKGILTKQN